MRKHLFRSKSSGRFISSAQGKRLRTLATIPNSIVNGRLYDFRGIPVRVAKVMPKTNQAIVQAHKALTGCINISDLRLLPTRKVKSYLAQC